MPPKMGIAMVDINRSTNGTSGRNSFNSISQGTCWAALANDSGSAVLVADAQGRFVYCNTAAGQLMGAAPDDVLGKGFSDFFEPEVAQERSAYLNRATTSGRALTVDGMLRGRQTRCTHRACRTDSGPAVMLVFSAAACPPGTNGTGDTELVAAQHNDSGLLATLTAREVEILRLIGQGLSTAEIASTLHRSVKTIEWHRVSLGSKLGQTNRVGLARIAILAGLTRLDAPKVAAPAAAER